MLGVISVSRHFRCLPLFVLCARFESYHSFVVGSSSTSSLATVSSLLENPRASSFVEDRLSGRMSRSSHLTRSLCVRAFSGVSPNTLEFESSLDPLLGGEDDDSNGCEYDGSVIIGRKEDLESLFAKEFLTSTLKLRVPQPIHDGMMESLDASKGGSVSSFVETDAPSSSAHKLCICALPTNASRNNHPMAVHTLTSYVSANCNKKGKATRLILVTPSSQPIAPLASAVAKAFPVFSKKTSTAAAKTTQISVVFVDPHTAQAVSDKQALLAAEAVADGVILAAGLVDTHPEQMTSDQIAIECETLVDQFPEGTIQMTQIIGEDLRRQGYGGLYSVGKAATCPPRLIILEYNGASTDTNDTNDTNQHAIALVGKGIIYDTGGLSIKPKTGMCGMKADMGGAAGLIGGFYAAVRCQTPKNIKLLLCVAENAIGPTAFRNDDILEMYSGKTVEVNNCDAEGRLVLADGVAHVTQHMPDVNLIVDMATLTGAQLIATGKKHAAILSNTKLMEDRAFHAGMHSGDLCFPLLYAPELLMDEFKSEVADMKNSVKDRSNAQTSCAGHFIESHLAEDYKGDWLHVDMAGPSTKGERATGYGVGLVLALLDAPGF